MTHIPYTCKNFKEVKFVLELEDGKIFYGKTKREIVKKVNEYLGKNDKYDIRPKLRKWCSGCKEEHLLSMFIVGGDGRHISRCKKQEAARLREEYVKRKIRYATADAELAKMIKEIKY